LLVVSAAVIALLLALTVAALLAALTPTVTTASASSLRSSSASLTGTVNRRPLVGIGDNNLAMFSDPRFLALGIKNVRFDMAWDVLSRAYRSPYRRDVLQAWLEDARTDGLTPVIVFDHSERKGQSGRLPTVAQFSRAFLRFRKLYPWVTEFVTWDEANYYGEKIAQSPRRAARYYLALRRDCRSCTIVAPDLLDISARRQAVPMVRWAREFMHFAHAQPAYWALNNYVSANHLSLRSTRLLLRAVHGKIWITETGGIVRFPHRGRPGFPLTVRHEAKVDRFLLTKVAGLSARIARIYLYEWRPPKRHTSWDTALLYYDGKPRPAYDVLANMLDSWGITPNCTISSAPPPCEAAQQAASASRSPGRSRLMPVRPWST